MNKLNFKFSKIDFKKDLIKSNFFLNSEIISTNILVIGGAGTIGSSYIKQILKFKPSKITVVDINENGFKDVIDALTPSSDEPFTSLVLTFSLESNLTEWKPTSEYIIELSKEIDDMAIAKYSVRDNHSRRWEDIYLGFIFKRLFGYFPDSMLIELKEVL